MMIINENMDPPIGRQNGVPFYNLDQFVWVQPLQGSDKEDFNLPSLIFEQNNLCKDFFFFSDFFCPNTRKLQNKPC